MCPHCRAFIDPKDTVCPYCENEVGRPSWQQRSPEAALRGLIPQTHFTTIIILLVNFGLFAATLIMTMKQTGGGFILNVDGSVLRLFGAKDAYFIARGEWWRLVTAGFLHGGIFHILMNSWVLFDLASRTEEIFGTSRFLVIYLVSSIFGFTVSMFWNPYSLSIGASAAACGLIGAMIAYGFRSRSSFIWSFYLRWVVFIVLIGLLFPATDNAAHLGGLVAGFVIAYLAGTPRLAPHPLEYFWQAAAGGAIAVVAVAFFLAYQSQTQGNLL
jgi:rhomboid protease GluP